MEKISVKCKTAVSGSLKAEVLYSNDPISFWGVVDTASGLIRDNRHDCYQQSMAGKVFCFPFGKGSTGTGLIILEMVRLNSAPAAIINLRSDPVVLTGPLIVKHFYGKDIPVVNLDEEDYKKLERAKEVEFIEGEDSINIYY